MWRVMLASLQLGTFLAHDEFVAGYRRRMATGVRLDVFDEDMSTKALMFYVSCSCGLLRTYLVCM
jgi:hypothetical protein